MNKNKIILLLCTILIIISVSLRVENDLQKKEIVNIEYENININNISVTKVAFKKNNNVEQEENEYINLSDIEVGPIFPEEPAPRWYLPTNRGYITQYPNYSHVAFDITSPNGVYETIYPIADGTVSGMYHDSAGALIVTVLHKMNGKYYTSQYVHLSSYSNIYVGKKVTIDDSLGQMGTTGISTGVHLHIAVLDCALFSSEDSNCYDLGSFYRYGRIRFSQGFNGLGSLMNIPYSWTSRK